MSNDSCRSIFAAAFEACRTRPIDMHARILAGAIAGLDPFDREALASAARSARGIGPFVDASNFTDDGPVRRLLARLIASGVSTGDAFDDELDALREALA